MKTLIDEIKFKAHVDGECDLDCPYCEMENEINEEYGFEDERVEKSSKISKYEKQLKKL